MVEDGPIDAPTWLLAVNAGRQSSTELTLHAEDAVLFNFERAVRCNRQVRREIPSQREPELLPYLKILSEGYYMQDREHELGPLRLAVWGYYYSDSDGVKQTGRPIELCTKSKKQPSCRRVAQMLNISYCTAALRAQEERLLSRPTRGSALNTQIVPSWDRGSGSLRWGIGSAPQAPNMSYGRHVPSSSTSSSHRPRDPRSR
ncbi:uncharacterized protein C8A04DRAFT_33000 [Dichotomopilus funicola]|uniref:Uncharacterized protein n=1 Tax=Dichotomopilus funicola TaxID=1934379 RepID=A0AAN6ZJ50_9PEZI|nr:hypothetical protein C8A04DRAFT_33000 [Dichotomopilus funicola]